MTDPNIAIVRLLISDTSTGDDQVFSDDEISTFLTLEGAVVRLAAATALDTIASNEAMVSKKIRTLDLQTDGPAVAAALRAHASALRDAHYQGGEGEFEVTTNLGTPPSPPWASFEVSTMDVW